MMDMTFKPSWRMLPVNSLPVDSGSESLVEGNSGKENDEVLSSEEV